MKFVRDTTWPEVFADWRDREASDPDWIECATKVKGWPDWESWRSFAAQQIKAAAREWKIFRFTNPLDEIPTMLVGPYSGWQSKVTNKNNSTFADLLNDLEQYNHFIKNNRVLSIMKGLPFAMELIGLVRSDNKKIVCLEGHHRATAIRIIKKQGKHIDFTHHPVTIALAELKIDEASLLDEVLLRGSSKNPQ